MDSSSKNEPMSQHTFYDALLVPGATDWQHRLDTIELRGSSAEKEFMCKKIVTLCTGVPIDKVEESSDKSFVCLLCSLWWVSSYSKTSSLS